MTSTREVLREIMRQRLSKMESPANEYTEYISENMADALFTSPEVDVESTPRGIDELLRENWKLKKQVDAARALAHELKCSTGSPFGESVDEARQATGRWLDSELDKAAGK